MAYVEVLGEVTKIAYGISIVISQREKAVETKIFVMPRLVPKKYKSEIVVFPQKNNKAMLNKSQFFTSNVYCVRGFLRKSFVVYETVHIPGKLKKRFKEDLAMNVKRTRYIGKD